MDANTDSLDVAAFLAAQHALTVSKYAPNQTVFSQGDPAETVFYIKSGKVKVTVISEFGKEAIVAIQGADEFCGEECLTGQTLRVSSVAAITDCELVPVAAKAITRMIHEHPLFSEFFLFRLLTRTSQLQADLVNQLFNSTERRLARALLILAHIGKDDLPRKIDGVVNENTLAKMIGTTPARINLFLGRFKELGFIDINGRIEVKSPLLNVVLFDQPHLAEDDMP